MKAKILECSSKMHLLNVHYHIQEIVLWVCVSFQQNETV